MSTRALRVRRTERDRVARTPTWAPAGGFSIIELAIALSVVALAVAIVVPTLSRRGAEPQNLAADVQDLALNLQVTRSLAVSRGWHSRLRVTSGTAYALEYLHPIGGWTTERAINLRANVSTPDNGKIAEFDTRGMCVSATCVSAPPLVFTLNNTLGWSRQINVYTRGLVDRP